MRADEPAHGAWYVLDAASGVFLAVIAVVGLLSALASPLYLAGAGRSFVPRGARPRPVLPRVPRSSGRRCSRVPLVDNLALAWLLVEATTGASALLVAYSGKRSALEAGWKYLVLTTFGLTIALLGIIVLYALVGADADLATLDWRSIAAAAPTLPASGRADRVRADRRRAGDEDRLGARAQLAARRAQRGAAAGQRAAVGRAAADGRAGRLARAGDARSGARPAAPAARCSSASGCSRSRSRSRSSGARCPGSDCWPTRAWSTWACWRSASASRRRSPPRASSLHVAGHALAKSLGFYAATPLLRHDPERATDDPIRGVSAASASAAAAVGVSLGALAALPPSPLFVSELLILLGGISAGELAVTIVAAVLAGARLPRARARADRGRSSASRARGAGARAAARVSSCG